MKQCWLIVNWTFGYKYCSVLNQNTTIFLQWYAFGNIVCKMMAILSGTQCVKTALVLEVWGGWGCEVSCGGHHRLRGKTTTGDSSGWIGVWHRSNTGLSSTQYEQIPIILGVWPFWLTPFFFRSITFRGLMGKLFFLCYNYPLSSGWHIIAA